MLRSWKIKQQLKLIYFPGTNHQWLNFSLFRQLANLFPEYANVFHICNYASIYQCFILLFTHQLFRPKVYSTSNSKNTVGYFNLKTGDPLEAGLIISLWMCWLEDMELAAIILQLKLCVSVKRRSNCFHLWLTAKIQLIAALHLEAECQCACLGWCFGIVLTLI